MNAQPSPQIHSVVLGADPSRAQRRVVFLHGLFGRGKNFTTIAQGLAPEAQSLLVDLPNHGQSGWTEHFDYQAMADAVAAHLEDDFAKSGPVDVVGHSMGGKVAMVLALRHPELVRRLVVIDIAPVASSRGEFPHLLHALAALDLSRITSRSDAQAALRDEIPSSTVRGFLLQNLRRGTAADAHPFEWEPNLALLSTELDQIMGFPAEITAQTEPNAPATFDGPVLWIAGERSGYITDEDEPVMRSLFPRVRRMTVRGAGHWVHSEAPQVTIETLRAFLLA